MRVMQPCARLKWKLRRGERITHANPWKIRVITPAVEDYYINTR